MKALIDGDIICYRAGFAVQKNSYFALTDEGDLLGSFTDKREADAYLEELGYGYLHKNEIVEPVSHALQAVKTSISGILETLKLNDYDIYLTGKGNFREKLATIQPYKGNRDPSHKPVHYEAIREFMVSHYLAIVVDEMEADDAMGIAQATASIAESTIIVSIDKDMDMIPGWHYNWVKGNKYFVTESMALRNFYMQLLTGDPTDNIRGVQGIGPAKATKLLEGKESEESMYFACVEAYKGNLIELNENAQLLWIKRTPFDMWTPPA